MWPLRRLEWYDWISGCKNSASSGWQFRSFPTQIPSQPIYARCTLRHVFEHRDLSDEDSHRAGRGIPVPPHLRPGPPPPPPICPRPLPARRTLASPRPSSTPPGSGQRSLPQKPRLTTLIPAPPGPGPPRIPPPLLRPARSRSAATAARRLPHPSPGPSPARTGPFPSPSPPRPVPARRSPPCISGEPTTVSCQYRALDAV